MEKLCPIHKIPLQNAIFHNVEVDYCPEGLGMWFERSELHLAKDDADGNLKWLDFNLWKDLKDFKISRDKKLCPTDRLPLYEVNYGESNIKVDVCNVCHGIWLDRGEFKKIMEYLKKEGNYEVLNEFSKKLIEEFWEIFVGPESIKEESADFLTLLKLLNYKFVTQHPHIARMISELPK